MPDVLQPREIVVYEEIQSDLNRERTVNTKIRYEPGGGLRIIDYGVGTERGYAIASEDVYRWLEAHIAADTFLQLRSINIWALIMVVLQISVLIMLSFEDPGVEDTNGIIRYISDNIAEHKGYGGVMLVAFAGSYLLLSMVTLPPWMVIPSLVLIGGAAFGGAGVVLFHGKYEWQHIGSAGGFIACGLALHVIAIYTGPWQFRHTVRDAVLLLFTLGTAGFFAGGLIRNKIYVDGLSDSVDLNAIFAQRYSSLRTWWWISGVSEYILYINMCTLNIFVGERIVEHTAFSVYKALPSILLRESQRSV